MAAPAKQKLPRGQPLQVLLEVAPSALLKVPAGQEVGLTEPRGQNVPGGHRMGAPLEQE